VAKEIAINRGIIKINKSPIGASMLFYHGHGERDYGAKPMPIKRRKHWEFAAILTGEAAPVLDNEVEQDLKPALWIFPPLQAHGWIGGQCDVCVVHLAHAPRPLSTWAEKDGFLRIPLDNADRDRIRSVNGEVRALLESRPEMGEIAADMMRGFLSHIALKYFPKRREHQTNNAEQSIKRTLAWLDEHLDKGVSINDACTAMGISPAHMRRLCHQATGRSPRDLLDELRLDRACDHLRNPDRTLEHIAWDCGHNSAIALSQAFLRRFSVRPGKWRKSQQRQ
jgi:AraC-like DNA-binding protein